ncbi:hypothetical protein GCM10022419_086410 [Nonomuraea rosea]|uniref:Uncharacterized protein n=1 Tax=Nonomuraea rosea TaxID=638574 RepID=A0ABP6YUE8_9ACTN
MGPDYAWSICREGTGEQQVGVVWIKRSNGSFYDTDWSGDWAGRAQMSLMEINSAAHTCCRVGGIIRRNRD